MKLRHILSALIASILATAAQAATMTYSFADGYGGLLLPNGTLMTTSTITTGGGIASSIHGGDYATFDGSVFQAPGTTDPNLATRISAEPRGSVEKGGTLNYANSVGFHVNFSSPITLADFYGLDIDGHTTTNENAEWISSFAFNGSTQINPLLTLAGTTDLGISSVSPAWVGGFGIVDPVQMAQNITNTNQNTTPGEANTQVNFNYGTEVTDLYVLWGIASDVGNNSGQQNSGVTGLAFDIPDKEPGSGSKVPDSGSSFLLFGAALVACRFMRMGLKK